MLGYKIVLLSLACGIAAAVILMQSSPAAPATAVAPDGKFRAVQITAGITSTCAVVDAETPASDVACWGSDGAGPIKAISTSGRFGAPQEICATLNAPAPLVMTIQPPGERPVWTCPSPLTGIERVVSGPTAKHTCVITEAGALYCWGLNHYGQLGNGQIDALPTGYSTPGAAIFASGVTDVAVGYEHTCAAAAGAAYCWGSNEDGQIGDDGLCGETCPTPVLVPGLEEDVSAVATSQDHSCVVQDGSAKCWGHNLRGQLGDGTTISRTAPVAVCATGYTDCAAHPLTGITDIAAGGYYALSAFDPFTCAMTTTGGVKCWGYNGAGQLGAPGSDICASSNTCSTTPVDVTGLTSGASSLAVGSGHACAVTSASVTNGARCWGYNGTGAIGDGTNTTRTTPVDVCYTTTVPCDGGLLSDAGGLAAGYYHTCAIMLSDSTVKCWGFDGDGQLGEAVRRASYNGAVQSISPVTVLIDTDRDGCSDNAERGSIRAKGGLRNPENYWDYFNPEGDGLNRINDISLVVARFGTGVGAGNGDPLEPPTSPTNYHTNFDRAGDPVAPPSPDGYMRIQDISVAANQFGHDCGWH